MSGTTHVRYEVLRTFRNPRSLAVTLALPLVLYYSIAGGNRHATAAGISFPLYFMTGMAAYGAMFATVSTGGHLAIDRSRGWSRQLRITPLSPVAYIATKMVTSLVLGAASIAVVYVVGAFAHKPVMPTWVWAVTAAALWIGSLLFAAFGLFVGYLLPSENVMQIIGFALMLFSFGGGLFIPLSQFSPGLQTAAKFTPLYGLNQLVHYPLVGGSFAWTWAANLVVWLVIFVVGAVWRLRRDTARM